MNGYWLAAIVGGVGTWGIVWFVVGCRLLLSEVEQERTELAREGKPCQRLTRYQR